jgi:hypothetical protein
MFYFYIPEGICFAVFVAFSCTFCTFPSVGWVKYDVLLFIITYATWYNHVQEMATKTAKQIPSGI